MTPLFTKLNLGSHRDILVLQPPDSFEPEVAALTDVVIRRSHRRLTTIGFAIVFVKTLSEVQSTAAWLSKAVDDAVIWFAYPKGTSKRYQCEFNRDNGWDAVRAAGFDSVRMVAIDDDWSAMRFRRIKYINPRTGAKARASDDGGKKKQSNLDVD